MVKLSKELPDTNPVETDEYGFQVWKSRCFQPEENEVIIDDQREDKPDSQ